MKKIYTSIDIGSDTIKFIVAEKHKENINVLAAHEEKSKGIRKVLIIILVLVIIVAGGFLGYKILKDKENSEPVAEGEEVIIAPVDGKKVQIFSGTDRPFAVMIDNHSDAWPQVGLQKAYMIYEIIVEGGETRLMALFKGANVEQIGPVRSARHYFIDYAMENDAIYAHFGQSPQAESDLKKYNINVIHDKTVHDRPSYNESYSKSLTTIQSLKKQYPTAVYIIDLHRDAAASSATEGKYTE